MRETEVLLRSCPAGLLGRAQEGTEKLANAGPCLSRCEHRNCERSARLPPATALPFNK